MADIYHIFFSNSLKMNKIKAIIDEVAKTDIAVLVKGESGTGKEIVAQAIHINSDRREKPFLKVNCAAIPENLLESELFGFEKGAFTGAHLKKPGKFELANGGTVLLNDIGETAISIQAKLLQVLQDGEFSRLGGEGDIKVNTRLITTTKNHLEKAIIDGHFREDLFFRINVVCITVPPLRERKEQIPFLSEYFLDLYKKKYERSISPLSSKLMDNLEDYHWPGNIRELQNAIERAVLMAESDLVGVEDLTLSSSQDEPNASPASMGIKIPPTGIKLEDLERNTLVEALKMCNWVQKDAAELLGVSRRVLNYKVKIHNITHDRWRRKSEPAKTES